MHRIVLQGRQVWGEAAGTLDLKEEICALWRGSGLNPRLSCAPQLEPQDVNASLPGVA